MKAASFFGHRDVEDTAELRQAIKSTVIDLVVNKGVEQFYFGGHGDFDGYCFEAVMELKQQHPTLKTIYCVESERLMRARKRSEYLNNRGYDEFVYLAPAYGYWYTILYYRNCEIVDLSDYVVYYIRNTDNSGAYKCFKYAKKKKKEIIEL